MKWSRHRDHVRRKRVCFVNVRVGRVKCAEMQHKVQGAVLLDEIDHWYGPPFVSFGASLI